MNFTIFPRRTFFGKRWFFNGNASNGEIVLQSEAYRNFEDAMRTVAMIRIEAGAASVHIKDI